jgi:hypothetical protein
MGLASAAFRLVTTLWYCIALPAMFVYIGKTLAPG